MIYREGGKNHSILFRNNTTDHEKVWEGIRLDNNEILERYGFTEIHNYDQYQERISSFLEKKENIYIYQVQQRTRYVFIIKTPRYRE